MAKSLGQIHSTNIEFNVTASGQKYNVDLPGQLSSQLQRMIRAGNFFKLVGIDMAIDDTAGAGSGGSVTGQILYYQPTRGRCAAFRGAFKAMADQMKNQGISMRENALYDFKAPINAAGTVNTFDNQATLDGTNGLALYNIVNTGASIFGVHNESVRPTYTGTAGALFSEGFDTLLQSSTGTDFVLNDAIPYTGDVDYASEGYESIPFTASWSPGATDVAINFNWRPDPALYLAVLCGQLQIVVDDLVTSVPGTSLTLNFNFMTSGWKSVMGNPDKKRRSSKRTSRKKME